MTTTMNHNLPTLPGRQRRSLNDTIGRLDEMIDGLSEAIPGTIRDTLQETVGAAVAEGIREALADIFANSEVLASRERWTGQFLLRLCHACAAVFTRRSPGAGPGCGAATGPPAPPA